MKDNFAKWFLISMIITLVLTITTMVLVMEPIEDKLDESCKEYGMDYFHRGGSYCIDNEDIAHPILFSYSQCNVFIWSEPCEIKFIKWLE